MQFSLNSSICPLLVCLQLREAYGEERPLLAEVSVSGPSMCLAPSVSEPRASAAGQRAVVDLTAASPQLLKGENLAVIYILFYKVYNIFAKNTTIYLFFALRHVHFILILLLKVL